MATVGETVSFRDVVPERLPMLQEVPHPCTYRQHQMDSVDLKTEHMKLRQKSSRGYKRRNLRGENQGVDLIKMYYMKSLNNKKRK